mmetsp:Transcript_34295/g.101911  ORF Transcript_34295/g.101911 Transcript_34295/m.101911 type:complete len:254 (+) Transcript_34295:722-1483(+)
MREQVLQISSSTADLKSMSECLTLVRTARRCTGVIDKMGPSGQPMYKRERRQGRGGRGCATSPPDRMAPKNNQTTQKQPDGHANGCFGFTLPRCYGSCSSRVGCLPSTVEGVDALRCRYSHMSSAACMRCSKDWLGGPAKPSLLPGSVAVVLRAADMAAAAPPPLACAAGADVISACTSTWVETPDAPCTALASPSEGAGFWNVCAAHPPSAAMGEPMTDPSAESLQLSARASSASAERSISLSSREVGLWPH